MGPWVELTGIAMCLFALWSIGRRDWVRLGADNREVPAEVIGHRTTRDSDGISYAAIYRFAAEGKSHEVVDEVLQINPTPPVGSKVTLTYPYGHPALARVPRRAMWIAIYGLLILSPLLLLAKILGRLPG